MAEKIVVKFEINDREVELLVDPARTVLQVIREDIKLTGTKQGCDDANCGVCTIIVDGRAVKCCSMLIGQIDGTKITTIEGLEKDGGLHPLQQAFIDHFAVQCGFCTPGMILTAKALLDENPYATEDDMREAMHGNMCRCTGYTKIIEAIEAARDKMNGKA